MLKVSKFSPNRVYSIEVLILLKINHWYLALFWWAWMGMIELFKSWSSWKGVHQHGELTKEPILSFLAIWSHIDAGHILENFLFGTWLLYHIQKELNLWRGVLLGFALALSIFLMEELVHLWSPLPPACGSSGWLFAHLPLCVFLALKRHSWREKSWYLPFCYFLLIEFFVWPMSQGSLGQASDIFHLIGIVTGVLFLGILFISIVYLSPKRT